MARHDDADRIVTVGQADGTRCVGGAQLGGDLSVRTGLAIGDRQQRGPHPALERRPDQVQLQVELGALPAEVLLELLDGVGERVLSVALVEDRRGVWRRWR